MGTDQNPHVCGILVAAGNGKRMLGISKQLYKIDGKEVIAHTIEAFLSCNHIKELVLVSREEEQEIVREIADSIIKTVPYKIVCGADTRQGSVFCGIKAASNKTQFFAVHDGVRPLITPEEISRCVELAEEMGAAALGVKVKDTIKIVDNNGVIVSTPERDHLYAIQTPQIFEASLYLSAMEKALEEDKIYTDDCQLMENMGRTVSVCEGSYENIKITTREDIYIAEAIIAYRKKGL